MRDGILADFRFRFCGLLDQIWLVPMTQSLGFVTSLPSVESLRREHQPVPKLRQVLHWQMAL